MACWVAGPPAEERLGNWRGLATAGSGGSLCSSGAVLRFLLDVPAAAATPAPLVEHQVTGVLPAMAVPGGLLNP